MFGKTPSWQSWRDMRKILAPLEPASFRTQLSRLKGSISPRLMESKETGTKQSLNKATHFDLHGTISETWHLLHPVESPTFLITQSSEIAKFLYQSMSIPAQPFAGPSLSSCICILSQITTAESPPDGSCGGQPCLLYTSK